MKNLRRICALMTFTGAISLSAVSEATFHLWDVSEIYSNHDGSVQFIEFFTAIANQQSLNGHTITATSTVGGVPTVKTFTFSGNLSLAAPNPSSTANTHMLIATAGFGALAGGRTPDYTLTFTPAGGPFFNPNADTISLDFAHGFDIVTFVGSALPKDGVNSLIEATPSSPAQNFVSGINSPTNFPNPTPPGPGSVNLPPPSSTPGDFTGDNMVTGADLAVWRTNFGATGTPTTMQGNADGDGDVDGRDFLIWQRNLSVPGAAAIPEPASAVLATAIAGAAFLASRSRKRPETSR